MSRLHRWEIFADAVLMRAASIQRHRWGRGLDPLAGSVVDDGAVERLIAELPTSRHGVRPTYPDDIGDLDAALVATRNALHELPTGDPFSDLVRQAALDPDATEVLALAIGVAWNPGRHKLLGYVQDDLSVRGVMVASLPQLLDRDESVLAAVAPDSALLRSCLVGINVDPLVGASMLTTSPFVQWHVIGSTSNDPATPSDAREHTGAPVESAPRLTLVSGPDRIRRLQTTATALDGARMLVTPEPADDAGWAAVTRTALCRRSAVVLEIDRVTPAVRRWITRSSMVPWVLSTRHPVPLDQLPQVPFIEHESSASPARDDEVRAVLGEVNSTHRLTAAQLHLIASVDGVEREHAVRRLASGELDELARRIRPRRQWSDLVLPADRLAQVREVVQRVQHRRLVFDEWGYTPAPSAGVLAMFAGPSGTGKTMSAEIIAGELGLDLFKVDLSSLVSKFIGETEKNLERIFAAAEGGGVVLVFDEADAVFGKRTQVSDAQDRYANVETSYLLQRIEGYDGLVVLTTNYAGNIDQAFMRRINVSVEFPMPDEPERLAIWKTSFPDTAPIGTLDFEFLANRFKLAGGAIRSAALTGAFLAADLDEPVAMSHVIHGVRREFQKMGRVPAVGEFSPYA